MTLSQTGPRSAVTFLASPVWRLEGSSGPQTFP